ncbi:MAG TPA: hypothetical protein VEU51_00900 [Candidatus Acidoferrales bacterium]|nr:hypothetical protein [Candidatus Acidoferrales bacterium]
MAKNGTEQANTNGINSGESQFTDELLKLAQALMPEPPSGAIKCIVEKKSDRELTEVGWKAYDKVVEVANNATNRLYSSPTFGQVLGTAIDTMLRVQRFNAAVTGAFFSALWPTVGLPTATEVEAMRNDVRALRDELREASAERQADEDYARELHDAVRSSIINSHDGDAAPRARKAGVHEVAVWSGWNGADHTEVSNDVGN